MPKASLNLLTENWIPVVDLEVDERTEVGLLEIFSRAGELRLDLAEPVRLVCFTQLLIALTAHGYKLTDELIDEDGFMIRRAVTDRSSGDQEWAAPVVAYLQSRSADFTSETFLQSPLPAGGKDPGLHRLQVTATDDGLGRNSDGNLSLTEALTWLPAAAMLGTTRATQLADGSVGGSNSYGAIGSRGATGMLLMGRNLRETIAANSALLLFESDPETDVPGTEFGDRHPDDARLAVGPISHLTAPSLLLRLLRSEDDPSLVVGLATGPVRPQLSKAEKEAEEKEAAVGGDGSVRWDPFAILTVPSKGTGKTTAVKALSGVASADALFEDELAVMRLVVGVKDGRLRHRGLADWSADNPGQWIDVLALTVGYAQASTKVNRICAQVIALGADGLADDDIRGQMADVLGLAGRAQRALTSAGKAMVAAASGSTAGPQTASVAAVNTADLVGPVSGDLQSLVHGRLAELMGAERTDEAGHREYLAALRKLMLRAMGSAVARSGPAGQRYTDSGSTPADKGYGVLAYELTKEGIVDIDEGDGDVG